MRQASSNYVISFYLPFTQCGFCTMYRINYSDWNVNNNFAVKAGIPGLGFGSIGDIKRKGAAPKEAAPHPKELYKTVRPPAHCYLPISGR